MWRTLLLFSIPSCLVHLLLLAYLLGSRITAVFLTFGPTINFSFRSLGPTCAYQVLVLILRYSKLICMVDTTFSTFFNYFEDVHSLLAVQTWSLGCPKVILFRNPTLSDSEFPISDYQVMHCLQNCPTIVQFWYHPYESPDWTNLFTGHHLFQFSILIPNFRFLFSTSCSVCKFVQRLSNSSIFCTGIQIEQTWSLDIETQLC